MVECVASKVTVVQPAVPCYRLGLFTRLRDRFGHRFTVYASMGDLGILTARKQPLEWECRLGPMRRLLPGVYWQSGALAIPIKQGDIVVVSGAPRCLSNLMLIIKARLKGARTVWWGHYWSSTSRSWRTGIRLLLMRLADAIVFYTEEEVSEYLSANSWCSKKPIFALNNGIDGTEIIKMRAEYCVQERPRDLLFLGRITEKARIELVLEALARPECRHITLDIIGTGDREAALRQRCDALELGDRLVWHGGITDERKIAAIANSCKLFAYPGAVGLSLIHALTYGLPAIVHDNRLEHMPEIAALNAGVNGLVFCEGCPASLADAIVELLSDAERLSTMSAAAIDSTARTFNADDMADRFCTFVTAIDQGNRMCATRHTAQPEEAS